MELRKCGEGGADVAAGDRRSDQVAGGPEVPHERGNDWMGAVSYTHLTLPTICSV